MIMNKSDVNSYIVNLIIFNSGREIQNITTIFIDKFINIVRNELKQYVRSILVLNNDTINLFILNILCFRNLKELNERINQFLRYIHLLLNNYKLGDFIYEL